MTTRFARTPALVVCALAVAGSLALTGCSSSSSGGGGSSTAASSSGGGGGGGATPTATASPATAPPPADGATVQLVVTSAFAKPTERIGVSMSTEASLAGKPIAILKTTDGTTRVISSGLTVASDGSASGWVYLQQSGALQAIVTDAPLKDGAYDPATKVLAQSGQLPITIS